MNDIKKIACPHCNSRKVRYLDANMFKCLSCETSFYVNTNQTTINHKHTYTNYKNNPFSKLTSKRALYFITGFVVLALTLFIIVPFLTGKNSYSSGQRISENVQIKDYIFNVESSAAFIDQSKNLKIFIIGTVRPTNHNNNKFKDKIYWAVYDAVKGTYEQIEPLDITNTKEISFNGIECFRFDDGNIYTVVGKTMLYRYDTAAKNIRYLNDEIITDVDGLQSGIASIDDTSNAYAAFEIKTNSGKRIMYFPASKVYSNNHFTYSLKDHSYPNDKPTVFFFQTRNEPSYLVKYNALYSMGYPICFNPHILTVFDENENFKSASFDNHWVKSSRMIDMEVLNTDSKLYQLKVLDYRDGIVALGVKTRNVSSEKYKIQWLDYNGNLLWSVTGQDSFLYDFSGVVNKNIGLLYGNGEHYFLYSNGGKLLKKLELDELSFDLD